LLAGKPVMLHYTREEEFFYDALRPAVKMKITSGIDKSGKIVMWDFHTYHTYVRGHEIMYDIPNARIIYHNGEKNSLIAQPLSVGPWRAPSCNSHVFAKESQIDIMASKAGIDPLEFRIRNLKNQKMISVLKAVAGKFGYTPSKGPSGRGYGIAIGTDVGTWVAHMAEVKVDETTGHVKVIRIVCGQDMGLCVNPEGSIIQAEGGITMALGYSLSEEVQFDGGVIKNRNYDNYQIPLFSWVPKIENIIIGQGGQTPFGAGEPPIVCTGAVIANAIFDATGARLYQMPMTPERILEALKKL
jgi:nicotinate dehydrogenase subunit B